MHKPFRLVSKAVTDIEAEHGQRRQKIYEAASVLSGGEPLSDELRAIAAETLRQWLAIEFYGKRNLSGEYERLHQLSTKRTVQTVNDMRFLDAAAQGGALTFEKARRHLHAKQTNIDVAGTLVSLLLEVEGINNVAQAAKRASEILKRDSEIIRRQYLRYVAKQRNRKATTHNR
ncbi:MAG: hypothetical protein FIA96_03740 [Betaproteobacteria bacterium]|nr:hypothetical protein [Betaproteobacteria bacterium]